MFETVINAGKATVIVMKSVLPSLYIGLFLANICTLGSFEERGKKLIPYIVKITGLPSVCALSVILAFGDRTAGMAALSMAQKQAKLTDQEIIAANLIAKAPSVVQFFIFSFIPIMISMYPQKIAVQFLTLYFLLFVIISTVGILYAHLIKKNKHVYIKESSHIIAKKIHWFQLIILSFKKTWQPFISMSFWMVGMSFLSIWFIKTGILNQFFEYFSFHINASIISVASVGLISMIGGIAAVGVALNDGLIHPEIVILLLLSISLLHNIYDLFASSLPRAIAIFGNRLGFKVGLAGFFVTQLVIGIFILFLT